jgi:hypothetical protein
MKARTNALLWMCGIAITTVAFALAVRGVQQNEKMVADLVRVPAGCATTIDVSEAGTYYLYVETKGRVDSIDGCDNGSRTYEADDAADVDVTVLDDSGRDLDLAADESRRYDTPAGVGRSLASFDVDEPGRFVIEVRSSDSSAVVSLGVDVSVERNRWVLLAVLGVVLGMVIMLIALIATVRRRRRASRAETIVVYEPHGTPSVTWAPPRIEDRASPIDDHASRGDQPPLR